MIMTQNIKMPKAMEAQWVNQKMLMKIGPMKEPNPNSTKA